MTVTVLSHLGDADSIALPDDLRDRVDIVRISGRTAPPPDVRGEVLFTLGHHLETLPEALSRGIRWTHVAGTGLDKFPLELIPDDMILTNSRGASGLAIAEWTLAVMLAFEKRLPQSWVDAPVDDVTRFSGPPLGTLAGATLAILGFGSIGSAVAERALPFGMRVRAMNRTGPLHGVDGVERASSLSDLLSEADHVVIAAPLTAETDKLIDADAFGQMKPGVHLANVARGGIVDQDALRGALDDGTVAMASLDAVDPEPLPEGHWMYEHEKVRLSPHISWSAPDAFSVIHRHFSDNLRRYVDGQPLQGVVDREARY